MSISTFPAKDSVTGCKLVSTVLGSPHPHKLARFYAELLDFHIVISEPEWVKISSESGGMALSFQYEASYIPPVWPVSAQQQQMMMHLDVGVHNLAYAIAEAQSLGATVADYQPQTSVTVMLDPDGHPFCLFLLEGD